ncbi:threonine--tRNA ligase [Gemmatimonadota bacterium Y43]|uniref:threonine--tRNA ligase n=1 Tax=Gaopeijia maritima TaxID=3119007 RepID=UPI00328ED3D1
MSSESSPDAAPVRAILPDGSARELPAGSTAGDVAASIGPGLAKAAVAAVVDGEIVDLMRPLEGEVQLSILTDRDPRALEVLRHSAAHVLATAVRAVRPGAGIGFGPAIEEGFYYDFEVDEPFTPEDLATFEAEMARVIEEDQPFERRRVTREEARELFSDDPLKLERLEEFDEDEVITVYQNGPFLDLCRGPHVPSTGRLANYRLLSAAGAYWRGDERRQMLQRIYGTAFFKQKDLDTHLDRLEEAKKRDHRTIGRELGLFSTDQRVGAGMILWHPRGAVLRMEIENYERELILRHGYDLVYTPHVVSERLFEISGHLENFAENMFGAMEVEGARYRPKPMNCPGHIAIYQAGLHSYRDLPIRMAEFGTVYRYERSGVLHGMLRVRGFTQDDAHVFCTGDQVAGEIERLLDLVDEMLGTFGYPYTIELATRPEKALGTDEEWDDAIKVLADTLDARGVAYDIDEGGGAFYGPKLDFKLIDAIGRKWQGPTVQLDFNLPERFGLEYVGEDNERHRPFMLHRVLVGSMERFVGGLIEHYAGAFPVWLAPEQVRVLPVSEQWAESAGELVDMLKSRGIRAELSDRETLGYRIRDAEMMKVPYMAVVGEREAEAGTVAVRRRGGGRKQEVMDRGVFADLVREKIDSRALEVGGSEGEA